MKKKLLKSMRGLLVAAALGVGASNAWAAETIGNVDEGWTAHQKSYTLAPNKSLTINFTVNSTKNTADYQGWVTQVLNGTDMIFFMQPSCGYAVGSWDWDAGGATYNGNSYNWDGTNFRENLQGASVNYCIKRIGNNIVLTEHVSTTSSAPTASAQMGHHFVFPYASDADLTVIFGADAAVLTIADATITDAESLPTAYGTLVGNELNGTAWWTAFSDYYSIATNETKTVYFKNYSSKIANWHNWVLFITSNADRGSSTEYLALRSDNAGWGTKWDANNISSNYNWSTFRNELDGAIVKMNIVRSGGTVTATATQIAATDGTTTRTETYTFTDEDLASDAMRFFLSTEGGHLDILPECTITLASNNDSYGTAAITTTAFNDGVILAGAPVTVTATPADGYVFNGWKSGEEYVSRNSTYTFTVTANTTLQAEFVAIKRSWDFTTASWAKETGFDASKTVSINKQSCTYANGNLAGLALQGGAGTAWTVNNNGLTQGNGDRNIAILGCTAGQMVTIYTTGTLSNPVNGTLIGEATTGTVRYKITADGAFGFTIPRYVNGQNYSAYITSITVVDMVDGTIASSGYSSLASAYGLDFSNATGLTAAYVVSDITKTAVTLTSVSELPANSGVILKGTGGAAYSIPVKTTATYNGTNKLQAAVEAYNCAANEVYILQSGQFHLVTAASTVPAGKAYLKAGDVPPAARSLNFLFADEETGISAVSRDVQDGEFYDLQGRRVDAPKKGLYIVNGTKVLIK